MVKVAGDTSTNTKMKRRWEKQVRVGGYAIRLVCGT